MTKTKLIAALRHTANAASSGRAVSRGTVTALCNRTIEMLEAAPTPKRKKPKNTLTLRREGHFTLDTYGDNHCGVEHPQVVQYTFTCRCSSELDGRGFLFDQLNIDAFFQSQRATSLSCELLVMQYTKELIELVMTENPGCEVTSTVLELKASPFKASMTYEWFA